MRKVVAITTFTTVAALMLSGCGKKSDAGAAAGSGAAGSPSASFVGTWKGDKDAIHKVLMAKLQRETPNMPFEDMETAIRMSTNHAPEGGTLDIRDGGTASMHQGEHAAELTWTMDGQKLVLKNPDRPEPVSGTVEDGILTLKHNDNVEMVFIKG